MTNSVILDTKIVTLRISKDVGDTKDLTLLGELPYAPDVGFSSDKCCLPGTRDKLITELLDWVNGDGSQQVLLLLGQAGRGKSAVAHTISQIFDTQNRLGAFFCFSRSYKDRRNLLFSTISRQLADGDVQWRESLTQMITKTSIRTSSDIQTQFNELIIKPSTEVNMIGPVVIVIDGLDESGDRGEREKLLQILQRCSELPSNYRFVITSRPELDIEEWSKHPTFFCKRMDSIDLNETTKDIERYISSRFLASKYILDQELDGWSLLLAERAEGLFQWARTVCNFIDPTVKFGVGKRVKKFVTGPTPSLYELYHQIFGSQPEFLDHEFFHAFKTIIGALIIMRKAPSIQALQSLFPEHDVKGIMQPLHSLFLGIHDPHTPIRPLHTSLIDFLTTRFIIVDDKLDIKSKTKVENQLYIDTSDQGYITLACLKLMNSGKSSLRFNICNLETSHKPNRDVLDLDNRMRAEIPSHLSYACYFWAIHLQQSEKHSNFGQFLLQQLRFLMLTNVLYLFEIFGLLHEVEQVCVSMNILAEWCKGMDNELVKQAQDTCQFGYDFEDLIMKSTPHLYISALPFAPENSFVRKQYLDSFPHRLKIELGQSLGCESLRNSNVMKRKTPSNKCALAFSPGGRYIATGFDSGELWLWNYRTGEIIHKWEKHKSKITSIVFSPNGELVTACFRDARTQTWNVDRNEYVSADEVSISGYTGYSTISNNGQYLVIDEFDDEFNIKQTLLYDITARSEPKQLACFSRPRGGTISRFSPNGDLLAFQLGRNDMISLWHNPTQKVIESLELFERVCDMAFFPDGNRIGIGLDGHVEIWDMLEKTRIYGSWPSSLIWSNLAIFPDGQHLAFAFYHNVCIRNVSTGDLIQSFAHESVYPFLAVSPDCKHIASVRNDSTIQVQEWESASRTADAPDDFCYTGAQLSPGGRYLILGGCKDWKAPGLYLHILDTSTMNALTDRVQLRRSITAVSPNDQYIAYTATNGLCLWSIMEEVVLDASDCDFTALAFSLNSDSLISGDRSGNVIIWNTHTCQPSKIMSSEEYITALAFSTTGTQFLVAYFSNIEPESIVEIHDSQSGKILKGPFISHLSGPISDDDLRRSLVAFSANESRIVLILLEIFVLDAETGQTLNTFGLHRFYVAFPLLSPNRKYLLIMTLDEKKIWDIDEGVEIEGQWLTSRSSVIGFSNKPAEEVFTVHETGTINFWNIGTGNKTITLTMPGFGRNRAECFPYVSSNEKHFVLDTMGFIKVLSLGGRGECQVMSPVYENQAEVELLEEDIRRHELPTMDERKKKEYALVAWQKALFSDSSKMDKDGWMLGPNGELLFWVPKERRDGLWTPNIVLVVGQGPITRLNFDNFVHGSSWTESLVE